jgi:hypothetical protein
MAKLTFTMPGDQDWGPELWERIGVGPEWERLEADLRVAGVVETSDTEDVVLEVRPGTEGAVLRVIGDARSGKYGPDVEAYWGAAEPYGD